MHGILDPRSWLCHSRLVDGDRCPPVTLSIINRSERASERSYLQQQNGLSVFCKHQIFKAFVCCLGQPSGVSACVMDIFVWSERRGRESIPNRVTWLEILLPMRSGGKQTRTIKPFVRSSDLVLQGRGVAKEHLGGREVEISQCHYKRP